MVNASRFFFADGPPLLPHCQQAYHGPFLHLPEPEIAILVDEVPDFDFTTSPLHPPSIARDWLWGRRISRSAAVPSSLDNQQPRAVPDPQARCGPDLHRQQSNE